MGRAGGIRTHDAAEHRLRKCEFGFVPGPDADLRVALRQWIAHGIGDGRHRYGAHFFRDSRGEGKRLGDAKKATLIAGGICGASRSWPGTCLFRWVSRKFAPLLPGRYGTLVRRYSRLRCFTGSAIKGRKTRWATLVHPAGANTLLTYLLPYIFDFLRGALNITWLSTSFEFRLAGRHSQHRVHASDAGDSLSADALPGCGCNSLDFGSRKLSGAISKVLPLRSC